MWTNLFDGVQLTAGDTILIHGGSGGIGTAAIQVAKAFGATVFTTARNAEKCKACEDLGATRAINYTEEDFVEVVKQATGGIGCSVVMDMVGGDYFSRNLRTTEQKGAVAKAVYENLWPLFEKGDIKPLIFKTFPLEKAAEAHALMASSSHIGKIMLTVDDAG